MTHHPEIADIPLQAPAIWPKSRLKFGMDGNELQVLARESGASWDRFVAQADAGGGTALLSSGVSTVLPAALGADKIHAVTACTFFAQCAANAQVEERQHSPTKWYAAYLNNLTGLGCFERLQVTEKPARFNSENLGIDTVVVELIQALALPADPGALVKLAFETFRGLAEKNDRKIRFLDDTALSQENFSLQYNQAQSVSGELHLAVVNIAGSFQQRQSTFLGLHFARSHFDGTAQGAHLRLDAQAFARNADAIYGRVDELVRQHVASVPLKV